MKKIITTALIAVLTATCFVSCGKKEKSVSVDGETSEVSMAVMPNIERPINNDLEVVQAWEKATDTKIKFVTPGNYDVLLASEDVPDIFKHSTRDGFIRYKDILTPLDDLLDTKYGQNAKKYYDENPKVKDIATIDGEIRFLTYDSGIIDSNGTFSIRKDWLDKLGLKVPETTDEWYETLKAFKTLGDDIIPFSVRNKRYGLQGFMEAFGVSEGASGAKYKGYYIDPDTKELVYGPTNPKMKEALTYLNKLYTEGLIDKQYLVTDVTKWQNNISTGRAGSTNDYATRIEYLNSLVKDQSDAEFVLALPIKDKEGKRWIGKQSSSCVGSGLGIYRGSKVKEAALKLIDYLYTEEGSKLVNLGIEGEHYNIVDGKIELTEKLTNISNGKSVQQNAWNYGIATFVPYKPIESAKYVMYSPLVIDYFNIFEESGIVSDPIPMIDVPEDKLEIITEKFPDISTYCDECLDKFIMGTLPLDQFDKFVKDVEKMGIKEITEILNSAK